MSSKPVDVSASEQLLPGPAYPDSPVRVTVEHLDDADHQRRHVLVAPTDDRDGVVVVARDSDGRLALVRQYRISSRGYLWELPRGFGSPDSMSAEDDAARELREETGAVATRTQRLGVLRADSGLQRGRIVVVRTWTEQASIKPYDTDEVSSVAWVPYEDIRAMIREGRLEDGIGLAALMLDSVVADGST